MIRGTSGRIYDICNDRRKKHERHDAPMRRRLGGSSTTGTAGGFRKSSGSTKESDAIQLLKRRAGDIALSDVK